MESVFDTYRTEPEITFEYGDIRIPIAKKGGGTLFKTYSGHNEEWIVQLLVSDGTVIHQTHKLASGNAEWTHYDAAREYVYLILTGDEFLFRNTHQGRMPQRYREDAQAFADGFWE